MTDAQSCDCPDGCLCTRCPVCRVKRVDSFGNLVDGEDTIGVTLANAYGRGLSHDDVVRAMRAEDVETELETEAVGEPEEAEWGDDPDPNAWGLHPIPVDREQIVAQEETRAIRTSRLVAAVPIADDHAGRRLRVTVEVLGEDESAAADSTDADEDVERETTWE